MNEIIVPELRERSGFYESLPDALKIQRLLHKNLQRCRGDRAIIQQGLGVKNCARQRCAGTQRSRVNAQQKLIHDGDEQTNLALCDGEPVSARPYAPESRACAESANSESSFSKSSF
jgi:hypothetical protein